MIGDEAVVAMDTPRLRLRTFRTGDLPRLVAMNLDPAVMTYLGGPMAPEASLAMAEAIRRSFLAGGIGMIALERRADGAFLGIAGLNRLAWDPDDLEVGWRLRPAHWGRGYATEAGRAWLGYAFRRHGAARVISVADAPNVRSRAVMERLGMRLDHTATLQDGEDRFEAAVHAITRANRLGPAPRPPSQGTRLGSQVSVGGRPRARRRRGSR